MTPGITFQETICKTALHELKRKHPYGWDLNVYRGCQHGCIYCYAQDGHARQGRGSFSQNIMVKTNVAEQLESELSSPSWKRGIINMGGVTDSYQPAEARYRLMPEILKTCIRYRTPIIISTKSDLVLRDKDLIAALAEITYVNVAVTVTVVDDRIRSLIEPGAASAESRFQVLEEFADTRVSRGLHVMPIVPFLTDGDANLKEIFRLAALHRVSYALCGTLYLRGAVKPIFLEAMKNVLPKQAEKVEKLYIKGSAPKEYKDQLFQRVNHWRRRYGITGEYSRLMKERLGHL